MNPVPLTKLQWAQQALASGEYVTAVTVAQSALGRDPADADIRSILASALARMQRYEESFKEHKEAIRQRPDSFANMHNFGVSLARASYDQHDLNGQIELLREASKHYHQALELNPKSYTTYTTTVAVHMQLAGMLDNERDHHKNESDKLINQYFIECEEGFPIEQTIDTIGVLGQKITLKEGLHFKITQTNGAIHCINEELNISGSGAVFSEAFSDFLNTIENALAGYGGDMSDFLSDSVRQYIGNRLHEIAEATQETLEDHELMEELKRAKADVQAGRLVDWEEVRRE